MSQSRTLNVYANPYASLDHEGRPSGTVLLDPVEHHPYGEPTIDGVTGDHRWEPRRYVGAELDTDKTKIIRRATAHGLGQSAQSHLQDTVWKFSSEPQSLPLTNYYLARLRDGEIFPADAETAAVIGRRFVPYEEALQSAKTHALGLWFRARPHHHVPDWAVPEDFAMLHEAYSSKEHKAAHAKRHAEKLEAAEAAKHEATKVRVAETTQTTPSVDAAADADAEPEVLAHMPPIAAATDAHTDATTRSDEVH